MGIRLGLVGLGAFGSAFAPLFKSHPGVDRIAFCDMNPKSLARFVNDPFYRDKFNPRDAYLSLDDILGADLDALAIITQPQLHAPQCIAAMEAGMHVYSAVPVISLADFDEILDWCDRVVRTCERTGMRYMLGETTFYRPKTMFCRRMADQGEFGTFVYAEGEYCHDVDAHCNLRDVAASRAANPSALPGGQTSRTQSYAARGIKGSPMSYPTHSVSGPVAVMRAHAVKACGVGYRNRTGDPFFARQEFSNVVGFYLMSNGATCRICEFRESPGHLGDDGETFRIAGTAGTFSNGYWWRNGRTKGGRVDPPTCSTPTDEEMRDPLPETVREAFKRAQHWGKEEGDLARLDFTPTGHGGSHPYLVHEFVTAVTENRQPVVNAWEAARYMAMGATAHKSALRDGEWLDVPDWGDALS
jgi:predicted dehydrogenase